MIATIAEAQRIAHKNGILNMWTVYDHPSDFPHSYVARRFEVGHSAELGPHDELSPRPTADIVQGELQIIRESFHRCGLTCFTRDPHDDPVIIETWL